MQHRRWRWLAVAMAISVASAACSGAGDDAATVTATTPEDGSGSDDAVVAADGEPITLGFLGELTGPFAVFGVPARNGMRMAVAEVNRNGGVGGRPFELVERDTQGVPEEGVTAFRGLVEREGAVAVGGLISSDVALATARIAEEEQVPLFLVKAASDAILSADSRFTFRTCLAAAPMNMEPLAQFIVQEDLTRVGAIIADYAWGRAIEDAINDRIVPLDDVVVRITAAPVPETDFTSYLRQLDELDPQLIIATGHPPGAGAITSQSAELGLDAFVTGSDSSLAAVFGVAGAATFDRYVDLSCADYADPGYHDLAARYHDGFGGFMEDDAVSGYGQVLMIKEAIEATGSTDPAELAAYLRASTFELPGYAWELRWTPWGELDRAQPLLVVMREQPPPAGVNPGATWYPEVLFQADPLQPFSP